MKKSILVAAAAAAVILAVVLTAGCVGEGIQQQTAGNGTLYIYADDAGTIVRYITLLEDGNGTYTEYKKVTAESGEEEYKVTADSKFIWTKEANGKVKALYADGTERVFTMDKRRGLLTSPGGKVYEQVPGAVSGAVINLKDITNLYLDAKTHKYVE